ncbi:MULTISPECIES: WhiB family transcriptional regulator [unclassified Rhodococcus (in: high G+C Gram-positive bacteria)]|jgi:WhiB family redox-sensing transcriptional regulator
MSLHNVTTVAAPPQETDWRLQARCRSEGMEVFFSPCGESKPRRAQRERAAKAICAACPVIDWCRDYALTTREPYGVWGGMSESDRRKSAEIGTEIRVRSLHFLQCDRQEQPPKSTAPLIRSLHSTSMMTSTSTGASVGSAASPTAERA